DGIDYLQLLLFGEVLASEDELWVLLADMFGVPASEVEAFLVAELGGPDGASVREFLSVELTLFSDNSGEVKNFEGTFFAAWGYDAAYGNTLFLLTGEAEVSLIHVHEVDRLLYSGLTFVRASPPVGQPVRSLWLHRLRYAQNHSDRAVPERLLFPLRRRHGKSGRQPQQWRAWQQHQREH
ncbi:MAG: hypothetical protein FWG25_05080, partial [Promicromonosporaceae bacterium]|nr:hypothetical protein [Promicromonosporaceae bacterium]